MSLQVDTFQLSLSVLFDQYRHIVLENLNTLNYLTLLWCVDSLCSLKPSCFICSLLQWDQLICTGVYVVGSRKQFMFSAAYSGLSL